MCFPFSSFFYGFITKGDQPLSVLFNFPTSLGGGGGGVVADLSIKGLSWEVQPQTLVLAFIIPLILWQKRHPFHIPSLEHFIPFNYCKSIVLKTWVIFSIFLKSKNASVSPFEPFLHTELSDFPTFDNTLISEIPVDPFIYLKHEKGYLFQVEPLHCS